MTKSVPVRLILTLSKGGALLLPAFSPHPPGEGLGVRAGSNPSATAWGRGNPLPYPALRAPCV